MAAVTTPGAGASRLLLEREQPLGEIADLAAAASAGRGSLATIIGRPGEGKTALLSAACDLAEEHGLYVCRARGSDLEQDFAFGIVRQLLEGTVHSLPAAERAELFEGAAGLAGSIFGDDLGRAAGSPFAVLHGLYWVLAGLAARVPMMLAIDDLHWADRESLQWLAYLRGRIEGLGVLVALACRPVDGSDAGLAALSGDPAVSTLAVGPLSQESVATLAERILDGNVDPDFVTACTQATGGNPFALTEALGELRRQGAAPDAAAAAMLERLAPEGLRRNVTARLNSLEPQDAAIARALSALGEDPPLRLLAALAGVDLDGAAQAVDRLVGVGLLRSGPSLRFTHPLLRAAVYETMSERQRARRHAEVAALLCAEQAPPQAIAVHLLHADPAGEPINVEQLRSAASEALRQGGPQTAVTYLRRALEEPPTGSSRGAVLTELGWAEMILRDPQAGEHLQAALQESHLPEERMWLALGLAEFNLYAGARDQAFELLTIAEQAALAGSAELPAIVERKRMMMAVAADLAMDAEHPSLQRLQEMADRQTPLARPLRIALALRLARRCEPAEEVLPLVMRGIDGGRFLAQEGDGASAGELVHAVLVLIAYDQLAPAIEIAGEMMDDAAGRGSVLGFVHGAMLRCLARLRAGELSAAEGDGLDALRLLREQSLEFPLPFAASYLAAVLRERGRLQGAAALIEQIGPQATANAQATALETRGRLRRELGDPDGAADDLRAVGEILEASGIRHPGYQRWRSQLAIALPPQEREQARALCATELADAHMTGAASSIGVALASGAMLAAEPAERERLWAQAVSWLRRSPAQLELARALAGQGAELRRAGRRAAAREPLREALDLALRCGADPLVARATEELHAADGRPRRPWLSGVNALTPSELRVAGRAAEGLSNRDIAQALFVTVKTIEMHLSNAYRKLGINSREQLPGALLDVHPRDGA